MRIVMLMGGQQGNNRHGYNSEILGEKRKTGFRKAESGELEKKKKKKKKVEGREKKPRESPREKRRYRIIVLRRLDAGDLLCPYVNSFRTKIYTDTSKLAKRLNNSLSLSSTLLVEISNRRRRDEFVSLFSKNNFPLLSLSLYPCLDQSSREEEEEDSWVSVVHPRTTIGMASNKRGKEEGGASSFSNG